ncbi:MAG: hypothetical protein ACYS7M_10805, partial [Planctomycetota bacterium]
TGIVRCFTAVVDWQSRIAEQGVRNGQIEWPSANGGLRDANRALLLEASWPDRAQLAASLRLART